MQIVKMLKLWSIGFITGFFTMVILSFPLPPLRQPSPTLPSQHPPMLLFSSQEQSVENKSKGLLRVVDTVLTVLDQSIRSQKLTNDPESSERDSRIERVQIQRDRAQEMYLQAQTEFALGQWEESLSHARTALSVADELYQLLNPIHQP